MQPVFQDPYGSLNPLRNIGNTIAEPLHTHKVGDKASRRDAYVRAARPGLAAAHARQPLPERALGRPAPARRDRAGARAQARDPRARRGGLRARRARAGADPAPARRPAGRAGADLPLHHPRPRGRARHRRPRLRDAARQDRRVGDHRRGVRQPEGAVHAATCSRPSPGAASSSARSADRANARHPSSHAGRSPSWPGPTRAGTQR